MSNKLKGNLTLLLTAIVWGSGFIAQKLGNEAMPPMSFNAIRQLMAAMVLCPIMLISLKKTHYLSRTCNSDVQLAFKKKRLLKAFFIVGFFMMAGTMLQQVGMVTVSAGKSGFISAMYIVFTPVIGLFFGERSGKKTIACIVIAMLGFALLSLKGGLGGASVGDWLTLGSAFAFAGQIAFINYFVDKDNDIIISVLQMFFTGTVGLVISVLIESPSWAEIMSAMPALLYATFIPTAIGYTLQIVGQKYTEPTTAALIMSLEAVFAAIFGAIFLGEHMSFRELAGCAVIFTAIIIDQLDIERIGRIREN